MQATAAQSEIERLRLDFENQLRMKDQEAAQLKEANKKKEYDLREQLQIVEASAEATRLDLAQQLASKKAQHADSIVMMESFRNQLVAAQSSRQAILLPTSQQSAAVPLQNAEASSFSTSTSFKSFYFLSSVCAAA